VGIPYIFKIDRVGGVALETVLRINPKIHEQESKISEKS